MSVSKTKCYRDACTRPHARASSRRSHTILFEQNARSWYNVVHTGGGYAMHDELPHELRGSDAMPTDDGTIPPDPTLPSVNVSVPELVRREVVWLAEHAE